MEEVVERSNLSRGFDLGATDTVERIQAALTTQPPRPSPMTQLSNNNSMETWTSYSNCSQSELY